MTRDVEQEGRAGASAAATRQSSQRSVSAARPKPAWTALRFHSAGVTRNACDQRAASPCRPVGRRCRAAALAYLSYQAT